MTANELRPWLSVLIPAYNASRYIEECLQSVAAQGLYGVEVIVTDDCSTDDTADLVAAFAVEHPGTALTLLHNERNRGLSATRNRMLDACTGTHVWFIDADDRMRSGAIAQLHDIVTRFDPDLVICDFANYHANDDDTFVNPVHAQVFKGPARRLLSDRNKLVRGLFDCGRMYSWSRIAKRAVYGHELRFADGRYFEDILMAPLLAMKASNYYYEPTPWVDYRKAEGSIVSTMSAQKYLDMTRSMGEMAAELRRPEFGLSSSALRSIDHFCSRQVISCMKAQVREHRLGEWMPVLADCLDFSQTVLTTRDVFRRGKLTPGNLWIWFRLKKWQYRARLAVKRAALANT